MNRKNIQNKTKSNETERVKLNNKRQTPEERRNNINDRKNH